MDKHIQLSGDGISIELVEIIGREVTLKVCVTTDGEPMIFWVVEHLKEGDTWNLSNCDIKVPCEITGEGS